MPRRPGHTREAPRWEELDALRSICALVDEGNAVLALARRPRGAAGHGEEVVRATLISDGELLEVEEARISTVYDGGGRQRSAGLELWLAGEEFSRRGSGQVIAGSSLDLEEIQVHAAVFRWRLDGREGIGAYELMVRAEPPSGRVIRALISDFGGVLTTPLSVGLPGLSGGGRGLARGARPSDAAGHGDPRRPPALRAGARRDHRGASSRAVSRSSSTGASTSGGCASSTSSASSRTRR